ncbi:M23 family metallopeptidase [Bradyrhizobium sp. 197]|uniref:M23 family metallopeptidase n=1 Tax=Bradyrhizobium sp. 197 TaxID=2782663 RepID=UPI001FF80B52|nr:peptidoglycan DD-metalloendopeptidase family protein [Bradyrhizobium sp. 197]MCK1475529.1 M23 family metallopeptidase [Bradyrhizobium sp. 197]
MLPPTDGFQPHTTSPYGAIRDVGTSPHRGVDANYNVGPNGQQRINLRHPALRSPVDGIVTNAGEGTAGRIAIRDADGVSHDLLHTHRQYVSIGDRVVAGQMVGAMGNMGVREKYVEGGDHHLHYQLIDDAGHRLDPQAFWNQRELPAPSPPAYVPEHQRYLQDADFVPVTRAEECAGSEENACRTIGSIRFQSSDGVSVPFIPPDASFPPSPQSDFEGRFGSWPSPSGGDVLAGFDQAPLGQPDIPNNEDWSAMWRRRTGRP